MISIVFVFMGVVTAVAVFAILAKTCAGEPKRAEKWEKGEIIKQLLALSEGENSVSVIASPSPGSLRLASASATRNDTLRRGTYREHNSKLECTLELRHGVKGVVAVRCKIIVRQHWLLRIVCSR